MRLLCESPPSAVLTAKLATAVDDDVVNVTGTFGVRD
jgi:hypothetical protein